MSEFLRNFPPVHGGQLRRIASQYGIQTETLLDFSPNINPTGPPLSVTKALLKALADPATLTEYPDLELAELKRAIAYSTGTASENICVANGFAPLLEAALRSSDIERCLVPMPAFSEYRRTLEHAKMEMIPYPLRSDQDFLYDPDDLLRSVKDNACDSILVANPQNPSGVLCESSQMLELVDQMARHDVTVFLDEAFIDYCPSHSLIRHAATRSGLVVFRSVTKFFAIPGLRVAYAVGNESTAKALNRSIAAWPVTTLAAAAITAALCDESYAIQSRDENERRRLWLRQKLSHMKIATYPSEANFLLLLLPENVNAALVWETMISEHRVVVRSCVNFEGLSAGHLRVAVRSEPDNQRLIDALEQVLVEC